MNTRILTAEVRVRPQHIELFLTKGDWEIRFCYYFCFLMCNSFGHFSIFTFVHFPSTYIMALTQSGMPEHFTCRRHLLQPQVFPLIDKITVFWCYDYHCHQIIILYRKPKAVRSVEKRFECGLQAGWRLGDIWFKKNRYAVPATELWAKCPNDDHTSRSSLLPHSLVSKILFVKTQKKRGMVMMMMMMMTIIIRRTLRHSFHLTRPSFLAVSVQCL
jgi:hypothetical protein